MNLKWLARAMALATIVTVLAALAPTPASAGLRCFGRQPTLAGTGGRDRLIGTGGVSWVWWALFVGSTAITLGGFVIRFRPLWIQGMIAAAIERSQSVKERRPERRGGEHRARARSASGANGRGYAARRAS